MHGEHNGSNGQGPWEDRDEFRRLMDSLSQEELRELLERLNADIAANPDDTNTLSARGLLHMELGDERRAEEDFGRVVDLSPGDAEAHNYRGLARAHLGEHRLAIVDYDIAILLDPDEAIAYYNRGVSVAELGDLGWGDQGLRHGNWPRPQRRQPLLQQGTCLRRVARPAQGRRRPQQGHRP